MKVLKRRRLLARVTLLVMAVAMIFSMSLTVSATIMNDTEKDNFAKQNGYADWSELSGKVAGEMKTNKGITNLDDANNAEEDYINMSIGGTTYYFKKGDVSSTATNVKVAEIDVNVAADVGAANELVSGFEPVIQLVIGILAWAIVIGLPLITALDVAYITIPFFREKTEDMKAKGGPMVTQGKNGESKIRWISDEAQHAVATLDLENGRSPLKTYLMSRIGAFIMVAIILYLLIGGQITVVTQLAVRLVSGIMNILSGLAQ